MSNNNHIDTPGTASNTSGSDELKNKLLNPKHWIRLLLMLLMFIILSLLIKTVLIIILFVQWVLVLLNGEANARLLHFTKGMNVYAYQIMEFITFNSDVRPFPLSDWPETND